MEFTYETIKLLAKQTGRKVTDLIALASQNDPFYTGTPGEITLAEWFARFYHDQFASGTRVHVRRCHYKILSLSMSLPNGKPYENTEECWNTLLLATKAARYLRLVPVSTFEDRKNAAPVNHMEPEYEPELRAYSNLYSAQLDLPDFPELPDYSLDRYYGNQRYHLELWCEKTTMNDILVPMCERYGMVLQTGAGELSISATRDLAERIAQRGKPARIFYISDYDPAGQSMPVAVARKLEYFVRSEGLEADIRLFPVVLTAEQVKHYSLPRTPIKESERRKDSFEARHGEGATELDALEALRPGELRRVLTRYVEAYYDVTLNRRVREARERLADDLDALRDQITALYLAQINELRAELEGIRADFQPRMEAYSERVQSTWQAMRDQLEDVMPTLSAYPVPEARPGQEIGEGLYNSERDYLEQIDVYKQFQGK